jgi:glycosyltransferase involved in cell wall biosynthesis
VHRLRIGIDAHVITGKFQGTRTTLLSLLQALARLSPSHDIVVYTEDPVQAATVVGSTSFAYRTLAHSGPIKRLLKTFPRLLREDRADVAVFQYNTPIFGPAKRIVFIHDILPITHPQFFPLVNRLRIWLFFTLSVRRSALVIVVSEYTRQMVQSYYKLPAERVHIVLNGPSFPSATYTTSKCPERPRYILTVGRIEKRKNIALLVEAFRRADVPAVRLVIVGAHDLGYGYRFPDDPRIENKVGLDDDALVKLYREASLFVYPSAAEGFGIPLLDALLFGIPTIASDQTAMKEIATGIALTFDPVRPDAEEVLARHIAGHFGDAPIPAPTADQRAALHDRFNWDQAATAFLSAVEAIDG